MGFDEKLCLAIDELEQAKVVKSAHYPFAMRMQHKLGIKAKPPHYSSFFHNFFSQGTFFGIFWGLFMYFTLWLPKGYPLIICLMASALAGILFGLFMASYFKISATRNRLTPWDKLGGT